MTLYELTAQYQMLAEALMNGDDTGLVEELFEETNSDIEEKAEGYARIIRNFEAEAAALKAEEKRLADKRKVCENSIDRLKNNLQFAMTCTGKTKFKSGIFSFTIAKNGGKAPLQGIPDVSELPKELQRITIEPDKEAIRKYIEETGDLSYGFLGDRGESLRIR